MGEIPREIGGLIHLRYLDLSYNWNLEELPDTMSNLYNLQTLRLVGCSGLKKVDLGRLINLKHLHVHGCVKLKLIWIETLTNLQTLDRFYVQAGDEGNKLEALKNLDQLQGFLSIKNAGHANMAESAAIMVNKANLLHLVLTFRNYHTRLYGQDREMLNALEPKPGLESLRINLYNGSTWSSLHSLRQLTLERCIRCESFAPLGKLSSLESLYIRKFDVGKVGVEILGMNDGDQKAFPKLKQLTVDNIWWWDEWNGVVAEDCYENAIIIMPCLSSLTISRCDELKALPDFLWKTPLQKLDISQSPILQHIYRQGCREKEYWAKISHIPNIKLGDVRIQQQDVQDSKDDDELDSFQDESGGLSV